MSGVRSKVEVGPLEARWYDVLMNLISLGYYPRLIQRTVDALDIQPGQAVLDLGSGTGRNDCLIARKVGPHGSLLGLDISEEMLNAARKRCRAYPNVEFREERIEAPLAYRGEFDKVFTAFVLHGFEDGQKFEIANNAYQALKPGGVFCIFDYNEFDLEKLPFLIRQAFVHGECQLAAEFLRLDLKHMLSRQGFTAFTEQLFVRGHLRLLKAVR